MISKSPTEYVPWVAVQKLRSQNYFIFLKIMQSGWGNDSVSKVHEDQSANPQYHVKT